jgi:hypothetical protein
LLLLAVRRLRILGRIRVGHKVSSLIVSTILSIDIILRTLILVYRLRKSRGGCWVCAVVGRCSIVSIAIVEPEIQVETIIVRIHFETLSSTQLLDVTDVGGVGSEGCRCEDKKVDDPRGRGRARVNIQRSGGSGVVRGALLGGREGEGRTGEKPHVAPSSTFRRNRTRDDGVYLSKFQEYFKQICLYLTSRR